MNIYSNHEMQDISDGEAVLSKRQSFSLIFHFGFFIMIFFFSQSFNFVIQNRIPFAIANSVKHYYTQQFQDYQNHVFRKLRFFKSVSERITATN